MQQPKRVNAELGEIDEVWRTWYENRDDYSWCGKRPSDTDLHQCNLLKGHKGRHAGYDVYGKVLALWGERGEDDNDLDVFGLEGGRW
jgi:hypothetical protein